MTNITITINLSDLVDVINNSHNPMVAKHLLSGGSMQDLVKFGDRDRYLNKIISRTKTHDGEELTLEAVVILENYNPWKDEVTYKYYEGDKEALHYNSMTGTTSWNGWLRLPTAEYGLDWSEAAPALEPNVDVENWGPVETPEREDGWDNSI